mmetsp:Transcript_5494/g.13715  ORF Transcript_5494/g.13715 Transcript_5494/m.13715 type:complete len:194 (-) Transcript_5494:588-1169(-)|eukprot:CAMPEP_0181364922 /NCGR_PEP_ID=MMETSP1106-20121128/9727_1 /TAXON_ID=81844 /ORGANISM="Mantoniella antarctica, Strain SL-175" /LENGTH=193 /DNA_ID=CAMNT_0023479833 /DNA_START=199 /DNA_END=780 /DNA_ORIENTATION=+
MSSGLAVIDLVAHLYNGSGDERRELAKIWDGYSAASEAERKKPGFELVRIKHQALSRMFRDDPDGDSLDLDDLRLMWEEFVDALRDASGVADVPAETSDADDHAPDSYQALEAPVMKRNPSFASLCQELSNHCSPEGSNRGIKRVSSKGTLFGVGASSRDPSLQGASALGKPLSSAVESAEVAAALFKLEKAI